MATNQRNVEGSVKFPYAQNPEGPLKISAVKFRNAWQRFAARHRKELGPHPEQCLPLLASQVIYSRAVAAGHGCGFDALCRDIVGACHWDIKQAESTFFAANAHIVQMVKKRRPGATRETAHVTLLPRERS